MEGRSQHVFSLNFFGSLLLILPNLAEKEYLWEQKLRLSRRQHGFRVLGF
ncbi:MULTISPECIES: hypothetical protein [unclassified Microcystis]|nr:MULTISPECIES: hypothetical protein [unclassified Microcystis]MCZ8248880.1 hypothetical protein [Microcystis sp. LE19-195.1E]